jgi:outer membrane receptor protein involved in Fe transport
MAHYKTHRQLALLGAAITLAVGAPCAAVAAESEAAEAAEAVALQGVEVTATRTPEPVDRVPASIAVISGEELRARGAIDLRTALSLVAGVDAPAGGDSGPAGAVVSLWGLHEFDAFLLVVDGVPWGGAFNPSIPTLDLNDVARIEVLKGAAPVIYGATAFVGVIQVIHYPAGKAANQAELGYGSFGSLRGSGSWALPQLGGWRQSLAAGGERSRYSDAREQINNGRVLYRGAGEAAGGTLGLDLDASRQHVMPSSPVPSRLGAGGNNSDGLNPLVPLDANFNPADARISETRLHGVLRYDRDTFLGDWGSSASFAHSHMIDIRGFLGQDLAGPVNAQYQSQDRGIVDAYLETHLGREFRDGVEMVVGADLLYGSGQQHSLNGGYCAGGTAAPFGCATDQPPPTTSRPVDTENVVYDRRAFLGQFVQLDWKPDQRWDVNGGLRLNETHERNTSLGTGDTAGVSVYQALNRTKLSGAIGVSYRAWESHADDVVLYADYRNTFKPAALDFGPDVPTPNILNPETARSYEAGLKGHAADGRLDYELETFFLHFDNVVQAGGLDPTGRPQLYNAGSELFRGIELEARYRLRHELQIAAGYSYHLARFATNQVPDPSQPGGVTDLGGLQQSLSPRSLASLGVLYNPEQGFFANVVAAFVGNRYLDPGNSTSTPAYITLDAGAGYRYRNWRLGLNGYNLTDRRNPATNSEFGDGSYYRLAARRVLGSLGFAFE